MRNFLEVLDLVGKDIMVLVEDDGDVVWLKWVYFYFMDYIKVFGIIILYFISFEKFLKFVIFKKYNWKEMLLFYGNCEDIFWEIILVLKGW